MKDLDSSVLNAVDLDIPKSILLFRVIKPPQHGSIMKHNNGQLGYKQRKTDAMSPVEDFTMTDLRNGTIYNSTLKPNTHGAEFGSKGKPIH